MVKYNFKDIGVVPAATDFVDIMLSRTNRQTPTIVRARWKISSVRAFYMRKVRFTKDNMCERLSKILTEFPRLDSIHPFYADLMNVLYDRDHYKIALSQLNIACQLIKNIGRDYIKLLKYGDSLYRCKQLKRAALGRMVKILKQQKASLLYLEQVRQHMSRLPCIDPYNKTILLTGFPSCGKSSFMNIITKANVEVAEYPFTTKSLYVGHCHYNYSQYQIIDSPGILDRELQSRNTIEMQAITALAHLNAIILFFIDLSPFSQYSIKSQCQLFKELLPLFNDKPCVIVCNKCDLRSFEQLSNEERQMIENLKRELAMISCIIENKDSVVNLKNKACDMLLSHRISKMTNVKNVQTQLHDRLFTAEPIKRDNKRREITRKPPKTLKKDNIKFIEEQCGGPGVFNFDTRQHWELKNEEWKYDAIPQFYNGKNISDFYTPNVDKQLGELEREEQMNLDRFLERGTDNDVFLNEDDQLLRDYIWRKHTMMRRESSHQTKMRDSRPQIPRTDKKVSIKQMRHSFDDLAIPLRKVTRSVKEIESKKKESMYHRRGRSRIRRKHGSDAMDLDSQKKSLSGLDFQQIARDQSRKRSKSVTRSESRAKSHSKSKSRPPSKGISSLNVSESARFLKEKALLSLNKQGRCLGSDRRIYNPRPLHLFKGKGRPKGR